MKLFNKHNSNDWTTDSSSKECEVDKSEESKSVMETIIRAKTTESVSNTTRWLRQIGFTSTYFILPLFIGVRGTSYLDLVEIYDTSISAMSVAFMITGLGGVIGGNLSMLQDRFPRLDLYLMSIFTLGASLALGTVSSWPSVYWLYGCFLSAGIFMSGSLGSSRALCFKNWRDTSIGPSPFVHSLFLFQSLGFFAAPLVARPFLSSGHNITDDTGNDEDNDNEEDFVERIESRVHLLFPALGMALALTSLYYLALALSLIGCGNGSSSVLDTKTTTISKTLGEKKVSLRWPQRLLILMTASIFFLDFSLQSGISNFLIASMTRGPQKLSKIDSVYLQAIYYFAQLCSRVASIVASLMLSPNQILSIFVSIMLTASVGLVFVDNLMLIQMFYALLGLGAGSILGTSLVWLEQFVHVGGGISGLASMGTALGLIFSTAIFGQLLEVYPRLLIFHQLLVAVAYVLVFGTGTILGKSVVAHEAEENDGNNSNDGNKANKANDVNKVDEVKLDNLEPKEKVDVV